jgi:hypothetical protein
MCKLYQRKNFYKLGSVVLGMVLNTGVVFAQPADPALKNLFEAIYQILLPASIILGIVLIIINGYGILTSEGDPRKVQSSRENLTSAILGLAFVLAALAVYRVVVNSFFGGFPN